MLLKRKGFFGGGDIMYFRNERNIKKQVISSEIIFL